jgi:hypothetical protein
MPATNLAGLTPQLLGCDTKYCATCRATGPHQGLSPARHTQSSRISATCRGSHRA